MDQNLREATEAGNISLLYEIIVRDGNVLRCFDEVEFIETPLHIAAEKGCTRFAMELAKLKSSFVRKLNHRGLSPMHIAIENEQQTITMRLLKVDKDAVRVSGKNDSTVQERTALHIAVENNRHDVLRVLLRSLEKSDYCKEVLNGQDEDSNTALHLATSNDYPQVQFIPP
ncbi:hypothetical protein V6N13_123664 [Hibiscus sabdariffa]|uniref:Uncharacterized protein n=1 Tax=Hibiscus sabdariffa TaxID=183260 RepID=A0ABR2QU49_9ROSI